MTLFLFSGRLRSTDRFYFSKSVSKENVRIITGTEEREKSVSKSFTCFTVLFSLNMFGVITPTELHHGEKNTESTICDGCCDNKESHSNEETKTLSMFVGVFVCEIQTL